MLCSWDIDVIVIFHFGIFFALQRPKKIKHFLKIEKKKTPGDMEISLFYTCAPKIMIRWYMILEIWCATDGWTDGQIDGCTKWHIEVSAPPNKSKNKVLTKYRNCNGMATPTKSTKDANSHIWMKSF